MYKVSHKTNKLILPLLMLISNTYSTPDKPIKETAAARLQQSSPNATLFMGCMGEAIVVVGIGLATDMLYAKIINFDQPWQTLTFLWVIPYNTVDFFSKNALLLGFLGAFGALQGMFFSDRVVYVKLIMEKWLMATLLPTTALNAADFILMTNKKTEPYPHFPMLEAEMGYQGLGRAIFFTYLIHGTLLVLVFYVLRSKLNESSRRTGEYKIEIISKDRELREMEEEYNRMVNIKDKLDDDNKRLANDNKELLVIINHLKNQVPGLEASENHVQQQRDHYSQDQAGPIGARLVQEDGSPAAPGTDLSPTGSHVLHIADLPAQV